MKRNLSKLLAFAVVLSMVLSTVCIVPMTASATAAAEVNYQTTGYASPVNFSGKATKLYVEDGASSTTIGTSVGSRLNPSNSQSYPGDYATAVSAVSAMGDYIVKNNIAIPTASILPDATTVESNVADSYSMNAYAASATTPNEYAFDLSGKFIKGVAMVGVSHYGTMSVGTKLQFADGTWTNSGACTPADTYASNVTTNPLLTTKAITYDSTAKTYSKSGADYNVGLTVVNFNEASGNTKPATKLYVHSGVTTSLDGSITHAIPATTTGVVCGTPNTAMSDPTSTLHGGAFYAMSNLYEIEYSFEELEPLMETKIAEANAMADGADKTALIAAIAATIISAEKRGMNSSTIEGWNKMKATAFKASVKPYGRVIDFSSLKNEDHWYVSGTPATSRYPFPISQFASTLNAAKENGTTILNDGIEYNPNIIDGYATEGVMDSIGMTGATVSSPKVLTIGTGNDIMFKSIGVIWYKGYSAEAPKTAGDYTTISNHKGEVKITYADGSEFISMPHGFTGALDTNVNASVIQPAASDYIGQTDKAQKIWITRTPDLKKQEIKQLSFYSHNSIIMSVIGIEYSFSELADTVIPEVVNDAYDAYVAAGNTKTDAITAKLDSLTKTVLSATERGFDFDMMVGDATLTKFYTMSPRFMTGVTFDDATAQLPEDLSGYTATATGIPAGATVEYTCNDVKQSTPFKFNKPGTYVVDLKVSKSGYADYTKSATFTLTATGNAFNNYATPVAFAKNDKVFIKDGSGAAVKTMHSNIKGFSWDSVKSALDAAATDGYFNVNGIYYGKDSLLPSEADASVSSKYDSYQVNGYADSGQWSASLSGKYIKGVTLVGNSHYGKNNIGAILTYADGTKYPSVTDTPYGTGTEGYCYHIPLYIQTSATTDSLFTATRVDGSTGYASGGTIFANAYKPVTKFDIHARNVNNINGVNDSDNTGSKHATLHADIYALYEVNYSNAELTTEVIPAVASDLYAKMQAAQPYEDDLSALKVTIADAVANRGYTTAGLDAETSQKYAALLASTNKKAGLYGAAIDYSELATEDHWSITDNFDNTANGLHPYNHSIADFAKTLDALALADDCIVNDGIAYNPNIVYNYNTEKAFDSICINNSASNDNSPVTLNLKNKDKMLYNSIGLIWHKGAVTTTQTTPISAFTAGHKGMLTVGYADGTNAKSAPHGFTSNGGIKLETLSNFSDSNVVQSTTPLTDGVWITRTPELSKEAVTTLKFNSHNSSVLSVIGIQYALSDVGTVINNYVTAKGFTTSTTVNAANKDMAIAAVNTYKAAIARGYDASSYTGTNVVTANTVATLNNLESQLVEITAATFTTVTTSTIVANIGVSNTIAASDATVKLYNGNTAVATISDFTLAQDGKSINVNVPAAYVGKDGYKLGVSVKANPEVKYDIPVPLAVATVVYKQGGSEVAFENLTNAAYQAVVTFTSKLTTAQEYTAIGGSYGAYTLENYDKQSGSFAANEAAPVITFNVTKTSGTVKFNALIWNNLTDIKPLVSKIGD